MSTKEAGDGTASASFSLASADQSFSSRTNDIFASLAVLEKKHDAFQKTQNSSVESLQRSGVMKNDPVEKEENKVVRRNDFRRPHHDSRRNHEASSRNRRSWNSDLDHRNSGKDREGFRRPKRPLPARSRRPPDFKVHPDKWTCYSLEDVSDEDLSDKANKRAALNFLSERKLERERQERLEAGFPEEEEKFETESAACSKGLISFSRSKLKGGRKMDIVDDSSEVHVSNTTTDRHQFEDRFEDPFSSNSDSQTSELQNAAPSDSAVKFKSRKNVKKHIRRRDVDDEAGQDD